MICVTVMAITIASVLFFNRKPCDNDAYYPKPSRNRRYLSCLKMIWTTYDQETGMFDLGVAANLGQARFARILNVLEMALSMRHYLPYSTTANSKANTMILQQHFLKQFDTRLQADPTFRKRDHIDEVSLAVMLWGIPRDCDIERLEEATTDGVLERRLIANDLENEYHTNGTWASQSWIYQAVMSVKNWLGFGRIQHRARVHREF